MSERINRGDRVRITIEGVHDGSLPNYTGTYGQDRSFEVESEHADTITVEVLERAVETFKPGDVVRGKHSGDLYHIGHGGYLLNGKWVPEPDSDFTSDLFTRVNLAEVPF